MDEKRIQALQTTYMAFETVEELKRRINSKGLEPEAREAARRELNNRMISLTDQLKSISEIKDEEIADEYSDTKKCPYCAEEIKSAAILCRYCKSRLDIDSSLVLPPFSSPTKNINSEQVNVKKDSDRVETIPGKPLSVKPSAHESEIHNMNYYIPEKESIPKKMAKNYVRNVTNKIVGIVLFFVVILLLSQCTVL